MNLKRPLSLVCGAAVTCGLMFSAHAVEKSEISFDFEDSDSGFVPIFADYPAQENVEEFYEFAWRHDAVPIDGAGKGLFISGNNHSDDLFMGWYKRINGLDAGKSYRFTVSFKLGTDVEGGMIGIGGSPGESVYVKCGVAAVQPEVIVDENGDYRLNIDKANQSQSGRDMRMLGTLAKEQGILSGSYEFNEYTEEFNATADAEGNVYVIFGTDSGFEAVSAWYLDDVFVSWLELKPLKRAEAAQMAYEALRGADDSDTSCTFRDVAVDSPFAAAIGWAQEKGYLMGYGGGIFGPQDSMTVQQAVVMLYRRADSPDVEDYMLDYLDSSIDPDAVSAWARPAVAWAVSQGMVPFLDCFAPKQAIYGLDWAKWLEQVTT